MRLINPAHAVVVQQTLGREQTEKINNARQDMTMMRQPPPRRARARYCHICQASFQKEGAARLVLPCGHAFHEDCFRRHVTAQFPRRPRCHDCCQLYNIGPQFGVKWDGGILGLADFPRCLPDIVRSQRHLPRAPDEVVEKYARRLRLNPTQEEATRMVQDRYVQLIQGPPGTGKTTTAIAIVAALAEMASAVEGLPEGYVLVTATTHVAVDGLLRRMLPHLQTMMDKGELKGLSEELNRLEDVVGRLGDPTKVDRTLHDFSVDIKAGHRQDRKMSNNDRHKLNQRKKKILAALRIIVCTNVQAEYCPDGSCVAVVTDEASMSTEGEAIIPISKLVGGGKLVLIGDHKQLGPTVTSRHAKAAGADVSLFERLYGQGISCIMLDVQYRMHPTISTFPNQQYYEGLISNHDSVNHRPPIEGIVWPRYPDGRRSALQLIHVRGEERYVDHSFVNDSEARVAVQLMESFARKTKEGEKGIFLTTHVAQRLHIQRLVARSRPLKDRIEVHTVDSFQGNEADFVIFSAVRTTRHPGITNSAQRVNVALTRARRGCIILGAIQALQYLEEGGWRALIEDCWRKNLVRRHDELSGQVPMGYEEYWELRREELSHTEERTGETQEEKEIRKLSAYRCGWRQVPVTPWQFGMWRRVLVACEALLRNKAFIHHLHDVLRRPMLSGEHKELDHEGWSIKYISHDGFQIRAGLMVDSGNFVFTLTVGILEVYCGLVPRHWGPDPGGNTPQLKEVFSCCSRCQNTKSRSKTVSEPPSHWKQEEQLAFRVLQVRALLIRLLHQDPLHCFPATTVTGLERIGDLWEAVMGSLQTWVPRKGHRRFQAAHRALAGYTEEERLDAVTNMTELTVCTRSLHRSHPNVPLGTYLQEAHEVFGHFQSPITPGDCQVCRIKSHLERRAELVLAEGKRVLGGLPRDGTGLPIARKTQQLEDERRIRQAAGEEAIVVSDEEEEVSSLYSSLPPLHVTRGRREADWLPPTGPLCGTTFVGQTEGSNVLHLQMDLTTDSVPRLHFFVGTVDGSRNRRPMLQAHGLAYSYDHGTHVLSLRPHWTHWEYSKEAHDNDERLMEFHLSQDMRDCTVEFDFTDNRASFFSGKYSLTRRAVDTYPIHAVGRDIEEEDEASQTAGSGNEGTSPPPPTTRDSSVARARLVTPPAKRQRTGGPPRPEDADEKLHDAIREKRKLFVFGPPDRGEGLCVCPEHMARPSFYCERCVTNVVDDLIWWPAKRWASLPVLLCGHAYGVPRADCDFCRHLHRGIERRGESSSNYLGSISWEIASTWYARQGAGVPARVTKLLRQLHSALVDRGAHLSFLPLAYQGHRPAPTMGDRVTDENLPRLIRGGCRRWTLYCPGCGIKAAGGDLSLAVCPRCWKSYEWVDKGTDDKRSRSDTPFEDVAVEVQRNAQRGQAAHPDEWNLCSPMEKASREDCLGEQMRVMQQLIYLTGADALRRSPVTADDRRGLKGSIATCDVCVGTGRMGFHGCLIYGNKDRKDLDRDHRKGMYMSYRCINCWLRCYQTTDEVQLRRRLQMEPSSTPGKFGVRTPRAVQDDRFLHKKTDRWAKCDCCRAEYLSASAPSGQWADQLQFAGRGAQTPEPRSPPIRGEEHHAGEGDSLWLCVDCIALWTGDPVDAQRQAGIKDPRQLEKYNSSLGLAWGKGANMLRERNEWQRYLPLALVMNTELEAHAKTRALIVAMAPEGAELSAELARIMTVQNGDLRTEQIYAREFWMRSFATFRASALIKMLTQQTTHRPVCLEGTGYRDSRPCFSVLDAWYYCRKCGVSSACTKSTVHEAWCEHCRHWMEWKSAEWAAATLQLSQPSQERKDRDAWVRELLLEGSPPHVVSMIATVLVHRKGFGTLWRYVADRARVTPAPPADEAGNAKYYKTPEVYVEKYTPEDHRIFFLLVMEELSSKCREAIMTNDQDIAARGGWSPPSPPPMSTEDEARRRKEEICMEARSRQQEVVGGWAPSLHRGV